MPSPFYIKQGDLLRALEANLGGEDAAGVVQAQSIVGNTGVKFSMTDENGVLLINKATAVVVSAALGQVRYDWAGSDTAVAGKCYGEFEVSFAGPKTLTFPNDRAGLIIIITPQRA